MNRRTLQITILIAILFTLTVPVSFGNGHTVSVAGALTGVAAAPAEDNRGELTGFDAIRRGSSLEYEFPAPPPERTRDQCERISRFCDWLALRGSIVETDDEDETTEESAKQTANQVVPDEFASDEQVADSNERSSSNGQSASNGENRSVVGWQTATVSAMDNNNSPDPIKLDVPSLSISADMTDVGIDANREMEVPDDYNTVGWYRYGPRPGEDGSSVIAGHLDDAHGRSVFFDLQYIDVNEEIHITMDDGSVQSFRVTATVSYDAQNLPSEIFRRDGDPQLALLTCGGKWDSSAGRYTETVVVFAMPID